jgi:hypothetical protein
MNWRPTPGVCALLAALATACGGGSTTAYNGAVQIAGFSTNVTNVSCHVGLAMPDSIYFNLQMVNTTASPVTITSIGSQGSIVRANPDSSIVGRIANTYESLPFVGTATTIPAHDGNITLTVSMPTALLCSVDMPPSRNGIQQWKDVYTSLRVTATSGQYVTTAYVIRAILY